MCDVCEKEDNYGYAYHDNYISVVVMYDVWSGVTLEYSSLKFT